MWGKEDTEVELPSLPQFILGSQVHLSSGKPTLSIQILRLQPPPAKHLLRSRGAFFFHFNVLQSRSAFSIHLNLLIYKTGLTELSVLTNHRDNIFTQLQTKTALCPACGYLSYGVRWVMLALSHSPALPRGGTPQQRRHSPTKQEFPPWLCWHFHLRLICSAGSDHGREGCVFITQGQASQQALIASSVLIPQLPLNQEPLRSCTRTEASGVN